MEAVSEFALKGGPVLGICNGFQVLCEAGLLPGALLPNAGRRFVCRQVDLEVVNASTPFTSACDQGDTLSIPVKHTTGRYYAPEEALRELEADGPGHPALRRGPQPQRLRARHRGGLQPRQERHGADAAPRARRGPAHRLGRRRLPVRVARRARGRARRGRRERRRPAQGARAHRRRVRPDPGEARARAQRARAGRVLADVVRALRLQALEEAARPAAHRGPAPADGPGRERRRGGRGRRAGDRVQGRVAQPPQRGGAVPGRGHRASAASCATCSRSARARSRCSTRCASASWTPRARATCSTARCRASATTATRSASRPWAARSTSRAPTSRTAWSTPCAWASRARSG